jgi:hypothetical protein
MMSTDKVNEERKGATNKVWRAYLSEYKVLKAEKTGNPRKRGDTRRLNVKTKGSKEAN